MWKFIILLGKYSDFCYKKRIGLMKKLALVLKIIHF